MPTSVHGRGVQTALKWLANNGYTPSECPLVGRHQADAYGKRPDPWLLDTVQAGSIVYERMIEVETAQSLFKAHAAAKMDAFAAWSRLSILRGTVLVVPQAIVERARMALPKYDEIIGF